MIREGLHDPGVYSYPPGPLPGLPHPGSYHSWHGVLVWVGRGLLGDPYHPWSLVSYTRPSLGLGSVCGNTARNLGKSIS